MTLWLQFSSRAPLFETFFFAFCFVACTFLVSTYVSRRIAPKAFIGKKFKPFIIQSILAIFILAFLLALIVELFYTLENKGVFDISPLISEIHDPLLFEMFGMIPTSLMVIVGFCGFEMFKIYASLETERLEDQLNFLRSQVNPHLTFNVLNHIHILMHKNVELADELLLRFCDVLRYQLYECNSEVVLLRSEIKYVKDIIEIEKMRWGNELEVRSEWDINDDMITICPLMFIPFIENAFKHVSRLPNKKGFVNIIFSQNNNLIHLTIENSKSVTPPRKNESSGLGLGNTKKRLEISYPSSHNLDITETDNLYKVELQIKLI